MLDVLIELEGLEQEWTENRNGFVDRISGVSVWGGDVTDTVYIDVLGKRRGKQKIGNRLRGGIGLLKENFIKLCKESLEQMGFKVIKSHVSFWQCPECKSDDISSGGFDPEGFYRIVECSNCGHSWQEVFEFSHSETLDTQEVYNNDGSLESEKNFTSQKEEKVDFSN